MKYLARALLMLAIVAVSLVAFTSATSVQAGRGVDPTAAFHCQGPDVWGEAVIQFDALSPQLANLRCNSVGMRVIDTPPLPPATMYWVTLGVHQNPGVPSLPDNVCADWVFVGAHFSCDDPFGSQKVTLQIQ